MTLEEFPKEYLKIDEIAEEYAIILAATFEKEFKEALDDNFNTVLALKVLEKITIEINKYKKGGHLIIIQVLGKTLKRLGNVLGILQENPKNYFQGTFPLAVKNAIDLLVEERNWHRMNKRWKDSDRIRDILFNQFGIILEDKTQNGEKVTFWRVNKDNKRA